MFIRKRVILAFLIVFGLLLLLIIDHPVERLDADRPRLLHLVEKSLRYLPEILASPQDLVARIRLFKDMWEAYFFGDASQLLNLKEQQSFLQSLAFQERIFPFNRVKITSVMDLYSSFTGKGIVMTAGNWYAL